MDFFVTIVSNARIYGVIELIVSRGLPFFLKQHLKTYFFKIHMDFEKSMNSFEKKKKKKRSTDYKPDVHAPHILKRRFPTRDFLRL